MVSPRTGILILAMFVSGTMQLDQKPQENGLGQIVMGLGENIVDSANKMITSCTSKLVEAKPDCKEPVTGADCSEMSKYGECMKGYACSACTSSEASTWLANSIKPRLEKAKCTPINTDCPMSLLTIILVVVGIIIVAAVVFVIFLVATGRLGNFGGGSRGSGGAGGSKSKSKAKKSGTTSSGGPTGT